MCVCMYAKSSGQSLMFSSVFSSFSSLPFFLFWDSLSLDLELTNWTARLRDTLVSASQSWIADIHHCSQLFIWGLGICTQCLGLQAKHLTDWAASLTLFLNVFPVSCKWFYEIIRNYQLSQYADCFCLECVDTCSLLLFWLVMFEPVFTILRHFLA